MDNTERAAKREHLIGTPDKAPTLCALSGQRIRPDSTTVRYHLTGGQFYRVLTKYQRQWTEEIHHSLLELVGAKAQTVKTTSKKTEEVSHDD